MTTPLWCLLGFAVWSILLVLSLGTVRVVRVLTGQQAANSFPSGVPHGGDRYWRLNRAHLNSVENLPIFGAIVVAGTLLGVTSSAFGLAATIVLCARVVQSTIHVASNSNLAVNFRFTAFLTQLGCFLWMAGMIALERA
jgi:uncharacterized MAPEG superfamily protein